MCQGLLLSTCTFIISFDVRNRLAGPCIGSIVVLLPFVLHGTVFMLFAVLLRAPQGIQCMCGGVLFH